MTRTALPIILQACSDAELAGRALNEPDAFAELYQRYLNPIYRYHLARTGHLAEAEDLTAETFFAALQALPGYRSEGSFAAWLFGIAQRKLAGFYRARHNWQPLESAESQPDPDPHPENQAIQQAELEQVLRAMTTLSHERAEALALCIFSGLSPSEAARVMGKSEAAVRMLVSRGLGDLRQRCTQAEEEGL